VSEEPLDPHTSRCRSPTVTPASTTWSSPKTKSDGNTFCEYDSVITGYRYNNTTSITNQISTKPNNQANNGYYGWSLTNSGHHYGKYGSLATTTFMGETRLRERERKRLEKLKPRVDALYDTVDLLLTKRQDHLRHPNHRKTQNPQSRNRNMDQTRHAYSQTSYRRCRRFPSTNKSYPSKQSSTLT
jgi:hypothetical protein